ncbi:MAG: trans-aconitate 2-methyltransferase [Alphaproteobacteria bacterium]|nr:trans-aconitate 2-methyltransferase [Alphaproteobacteria bacterium]
MSWDPDIYMKFASERTRPAMELLARVPLSAPARVIDLGCGPGNSMALLAARWPRAKIEGLESSPEMLAKARMSGVRANWVEGDVESWSPKARYDVIFSNATLHWIPTQHILLPRLMGFVADGGALAFQMPRNFDAPSHVLMREVAGNGPWSIKLVGARQVNVLSPDVYFDILAPLAVSVDIWETTYLHVLDGDDPVLTWVSGTGLRPFVQPLGADEREDFIAQYRARLRDAYPRRADGKTLFPFRRLFVVALK